VVASQSVVNDDETPKKPAKDLTTSRLGRFMKLAALAPKALPLGAIAVKEAIRARRDGGPKQDGVRGEESQAPVIDLETLEKARGTAKAMLQTLGDMKGLPLKFGQMASYIDGLAPPGYEEKFQEVLTTLQSKAPPLSAEAARSVIVAELGEEPEAIFEAWESEPFAAASIGQVHKAVTRGGERVAVKVQYPGVDKAIENDLKTFGVLEGMLAPFGARRYHTKETLEEIRTVFLSELDYRNEADNSERFRSIHAGDTDIVIPRGYPSLSAKRVATMQLMDGKDYASFTATATQAERNRAGEAIWRFIFRALYTYGILYADPHPGNYRFLDDGRVAFLDFGCVRILPHPIVQNLKDLPLALMDGDEARFHEVCVAGFGFKQEDAEAYALYTEYSRLLMAPFTTTFYRHTHEAARETVAFLVRNGKRAVQKDGSTLPKMPTPIDMPAEHTFVNRLQWGLSSVMAGIGAEGNYRAISEPYLRSSLQALPK
jgi:predicted unusual protein kinase regulating ubiquinone biosynthesis (AarF/ABC1/UbiB family)